MSMNPRTEAARHAHGDNYPVTMALLHVGDKLEELGRILEAVKENLSMPPYPHYTAIETRALDDERVTYVPGELRGVGSSPDPADVAIQKMRDAIMVPGPRPRLHWDTVDRLRREWPTLWEAIQELTGLEEVGG